MQYVRSLVLLMTFLFLQHQSAFASDSTHVHRQFFPTLGDDISLVWGDVGVFFTQPLRFDGADWRNAAIIVGGTGLLMPLDSSGRKMALGASHNNTTSSIMTAGRHYGDFLIAGPLVGVTYLGGLIFRCDDLRTTGRELIETLALAGATTTVLKYVIGRSRPYTSEGPFSFHPLSFSNSRNSLPSGHTTVAFSISSVLAARIKNPIATVLLYGAATVTAVSRMYHDQHWLSDTFLGAAIATTTGLWVVHRDETREFGEPSHTDGGLFITPGVGSLSLTYKF